MSNNTEDTGIIEALLQRLNDFRLPRLLELQGRVDAGATLTESDMDFLEQSLEDASSSRALIDRHPEIHPLAVKLTALYHDITAKGLENEQKAESR